MKRVLVTGASNIGKAGVATIIYKWGQEFNSYEVVYDYLMQRGLPDQQYIDAIEKKGGRIYTLNDEHRSMFGIIKWVEKIVRENNYETIHINTDTAYIATAYIYAAKKGGIRHIFVHSHCTQVDDNNIASRFIKTSLHKLCMRYVCNNSEMYLACSKLAGYWMFGMKNVESSKYQTIYNGVKVEQYLFNEQIRIDYRKRMGLENKFVIGNIGRFSYQKNHEFLIKIFAELSKSDSDAVLILIGTGNLENTIREQVNALNISDKVMFLGTRDDVPALLSMFDVLVMPSRFEGLPVTMVEAEMNSLPCVVSNTITREAKFMDAVIYVDEWNIIDWIDNILFAKLQGRKVNKEALIASKFNIRNAVLELQQILVRDDK